MAQDHVDAEARAEGCVAVGVIARDEERSIERCLRSVLRSDVCEVVVLDTGSTDATMSRISSIADARLRLCRIDWGSSFAEARNAVLGATRCRTVAFIDADEWLEDGSAERLVRSIISARREHPQADVLSPSIREAGTPDVFRGLGRVILDRTRTRYRGRIHEYPVVGDCRAVIAELDVTFLHDGYTSVSSAVLRAKRRRNVELLGLALSEEPTSPHLRFFDLRERLCTGTVSAAEVTRAIERLERSRSNDSEPRDRHAYVHQGLVEGATWLICAGALREAGAVIERLRLMSPGARADAEYFAAVLALTTGVDVDEGFVADLVETRRDGEAMEGARAGGGDHLDAAVCCLLEQTGQREEAARCRALSRAWTDSFFVDSRLRVRGLP